jgi:hypothetical protein
VAHATIQILEVDQAHILVLEELLVVLVITQLQELQATAHRFLALVITVQ